MRFLLPSVLVLAVLLTGCAMTPTATPSATAGATIKGMVHGGQQPLVGAEVFLFAANTAGYGGASVSLLQSAANTTLDSNMSDATYGDYYVTTDGTGSFSISNDYTCTSTQQVYLYALGGNPGAGNNTSAGLLAALGQCPGTGNFAATPYIFMDEVSTIATAYAIAGFATDALHVADDEGVLSNTYATQAKNGMANAFANVTNLETLGTGNALATTPAGNGTVPQKTINTLANILAACINSNGSITPPSSGPPVVDASNCYTLFYNAESAGSTGTVPTDTATAAINIAHNPGSNIAALYGLSSANPPFATALSSQPNDFTIGINFTGGGITRPEAVAIDAAGNAWIANTFGQSAVELSPLGAIKSGANGFDYSAGVTTGPRGIAVDQSDDVWLANSYNNTVVEMNSAGSILHTFSGSDLSSPGFVAVDGKGDVWVADSGGTGFSWFVPSGNSYTETGKGYTYFSSPQGIAIDGSGNVWFAVYGQGSLWEVYGTAGGPNGHQPGDALNSSTGFTGGGLNYPYGLAIDGAGNAWVGNANSTALSEFANAGTPNASSPFSGGGIYYSESVAIDGAGNIWAGGGFGSTSMAEMSRSGTPISPSTGYQGGSQDVSLGIAVDGSGNVWATNYSGSSVTELIGAATPAITPICAALPSTFTANGTSNLGTRP